MKRCSNKRKYQAITLYKMASIVLERRSDAIPTDEPIEHDDQVYEVNAEVECRPTYASFHDQIKKTQDVFQDLKNDIMSSITVFENNIATLNAKEERLVKLSRKISSINFESAIKLNVGGLIYQTSLETLTKYPGSLLADMFSACFDLKQGNDGCYFIDRDGKHFIHILNYLRFGTAPVLSVLTTYTEEILEEAEFYGLVGLVKAINAKLNRDNDCSSENIKDKDEIAINDMVDEARKELRATEEKLKSFLNLLEANLKVLDEATSHHNEVSKKLSNFHFGENVKIDVGGRIFKTSLKTLRREPESFLASMFSNKFDLQKEDDGSFFIDRDGTCFQHILEYLRDGKVSKIIIEKYESQMQKEAEFYGLSGLKEQIQNYNHVKLNVGGRDFVVTRDVLKQYPESMFGRMLAGKGCAVKKRENGSFYTERDGTNFHHILEYLRYGIISDDVIKERGISLSNDAKFYMLPSLEEQIQKYYNIKVDVAGREFAISRKMLGKFPESLFGKMLAGKDGEYVKRSNGSYFIEYDGTNFHHILSYLRSDTLSDDVLEKHSVSLLADAEFYMLPGLRDRINDYENVKLSISGREFVVNRRVLNKFPDSLFGKMLAREGGNYVRRDDGSYCIKRDDSVFPHILDYLKSETLSDNVISRKLMSPLLLADAEFYVLPGLAEIVRNYHNIKMIIGDREFVISRKVLEKFPDSLFGRMLAGEEGGYVKRIDGSYFIQYDDGQFHHVLDYLRSGTLSDGVIEKHSASLLDAAEFYMLPDLKEQVIKYTKFKVIIGRREFFISREVLNKFPDSLFGRMLRGVGRGYLKRDDGSYYIDRDASMFPCILHILNVGLSEQDCPRKWLQRLKYDLLFYKPFGDI